MWQDLQSADVQLADGGDALGCPPDALDSPSDISTPSHRMVRPVIAPHPAASAAICHPGSPSDEDSVEDEPFSLGTDEAYDGHWSDQGFAAVASASCASGTAEAVTSEWVRSGAPPLEDPLPPVPLAIDRCHIKRVLDAALTRLSRDPWDLQKFRLLESVCRTGCTASELYKQALKQWQTDRDEFGQGRAAACLQTKPTKVAFQLSSALEEMQQDPAGLSPATHQAPMPVGVLHGEDQLGHLSVCGAHILDIATQILACTSPICLLPDVGAGEWADPVFTPGVELDMGAALAHQVSAAWAESDAVCRAAFTRECQQRFTPSHGEPAFPFPPSPALSTPRYEAGRFKAYVMAGKQIPSDSTMSHFQGGECARQSFALTIKHGALPLVLSLFMDGASTGQRGAHELTPVSVRCLQLPTKEGRSVSAAHLLAMVPNIASLKVATDPRDRGHVPPDLLRHRAFQSILETICFKPLSRIWASGGLAIPVPLEAEAPLKARGVHVTRVEHAGSQVLVAKVLPVVGLLSLDMKEAWRVFNLKAQNQISCSCQPKKSHVSSAQGVSASVMAREHCRLRGGREHIEALQAHRAGSVSEEQERILLQRRFRDDPCVVERYAWLFPGGSPYAARPPDRLHVFAATLAGDRVWSIVQESIKVQPESPTSTIYTREQRFQKRLRETWTQEIDGTRLIGASRSAIHRLLSCAMLSMEQRVGILPHLAWVVANDDSVVASVPVRQLLQLLFGTLEVLCHFLYVRPVSGPEDPARISQWFGRLSTVYSLLAAYTSRRSRKRPRAAAGAGHGDDPSSQVQGGNEKVPARSVDYPKVHASLHFGGALWWFGSLEATDTDTGESFHTIVTSAWRSLNAGKPDLLRRITERVLFVGWYSRYQLKAPPSTSITSEWEARCHFWRSAQVTNPDGNRYPTLASPVRSRPLGEVDLPYLSRVPSWAFPALAGWIRKHAKRGPSGGCHAKLPAGTVIGDKTAQRSHRLQLFQKMKLGFASGNSNMVSLPAFLDVVVNTQYGGAPWRRLDHVLALLCLAPQEDRTGSHYDSVGTPFQRVSILYIDLPPAPTDVPGWARVNKPTTEVCPKLMDGTSLRGVSVVLRRPSLLRAPDENYLHHWLQAGLAGKQRQTSAPTGR